MFLAYVLYKAGAYCRTLHGVRNRGRQLNLKACYKRCSGNPFFAYHEGQERSQCDSSGCKCECVLNTDEDGGCETKSRASINVYKVVG